MATNDRVLLTVLLHHDQSKTLDEIMAHLEQKAWSAFRYQVFPSYDFAPIAADLRKQHA
jgi:D-alanyl-D-alanine carboxypeptidase